MTKEEIQEDREWKILGFTDEMKNLVNLKLMEDCYSYWFRYRSIPWYKKRRIKGVDPKYLIEEALKTLQLEVNVRREKQNNYNSYYWLIEPRPNSSDRKLEK